jgi:hypothetical protein
MQNLTLRVSFPDDDSIWRSIEIADEHTLEALHYAIQKAFGWDADHLYSFYMSGKRWDEKTEYRVPEEEYLGFKNWEIIDDQEAHDGAPEDPLAAFANVSNEDLDALMIEVAGKLGVSVEKLQAMIEETEEEPYERDVRYTRLATLGLKRGRRFLYLFDYGDEYFFPIRVEAITPLSGDEIGGPRVVAMAGEAPLQYPIWPDDEYEDEDEKDKDANPPPAESDQVL